MKGARASPLEVASPHMAMVPRTHDEVAYYPGHGKVVFGIVTLVIEQDGVVVGLDATFEQDVRRPNARGFTRTLQFEGFDRCSSDALRGTEPALWRRVDYLQVLRAQGDTSSSA